MIDDSRNKISRLTFKLQKQTRVSLWSIANEKLIYAIAVGEKPDWGSKMWLLHRIMSVANKLKISSLIIFIVGLSRAFSIWWRVQKKIRRSHQLLPFKRIFAGFGASSEEYLYRDYIKRSKDMPLRINWATHEGLHELGCPTLTSIIFSLIRNSFGYVRKIENAIPEISSNPVYFLTVCAFNIGGYSFYQSYWRMAKKFDINEVCFLVLDIPAFASVSENVKTIYLQHGLMAFTILIPKVHTIEVLTLEEERYLKSFVENISIYRATMKINLSYLQKNNTLMLLSLNIFYEERILLSQSLIQWAIKFGLQVVIRPTRHVSKNELATLMCSLSHVLLDDLDIPLEDSFMKWKPKLVAAWSSTGLATALDYGSIPISLYSPDVDAIWNNMIYPMKHRILFWCQDKNRIEAAIKSQEAYQAQLNELQSYQEHYPDD